MESSPACIARAETKPRCSPFPSLLKEVHYENWWCMLAVPTVPHGTAITMTLHQNTLFAGNNCCWRKMRSICSAGWFIPSNDTDKVFIILVLPLSYYSWWQDSGQSKKKFAAWLFGQDVKTRQKCLGLWVFWWHPHISHRKHVPDLRHGHNHIADSRMVRDVQE